MNKISLIFSVLLFFSYGKAQTYSLMQAKEIALQNNENLKNSVLDERIAHLKYIETRAIGLPQVNFNGSFSNFINLPVQVVSANFINPNAGPDDLISFRAGTDYSASGTLQVSQLLFNGSYLVGLQFSKFYASMAKVATEKSKEDVLYSVTQAYQFAAIAKENVRFMDSIVVVTSKLLDKQANFFELGLITQEEVDQLNFSLTNAQNSLASAKIQEENALAMLKFAMGINLNDNISITESASTLMGRSVDFNSGLNANMNYVLLANQLTLNEYNLKNKKAANLPSLSSFFQQTYNAFRNEFNFFADEKWFPQTLWGIQLQVPIFASGSRWSQIEQTKVEIEKLKNNLTALEKGLQLQATQLQNNLTNAYNTLSLQEKNVQLAKRIYENELIREEIGKGNSLLVTQKYNQLVIAQAQYVGAQLDVLNNKLELEKLYHQIK